MILGDCFGVPGIIVDTHIKRVSQRLGLTKNSDPTKIEFDLMEIFYHIFYFLLDLQGKIGILISLCFYERSVRMYLMRV